MANETMEVEMPDGTIVSDVPVGMTKEQLLQKYSRYSAKNQLKFEPQEDTAYSPEGMPLVTPTSAATPTGAGKMAQDVMADVVGAPVRAGMSLAKPVANVLNMAGVSAPQQAVKQMDTGIKEAGPEVMGIKGPMGSAASLGADIWGGNKILQGLGKVAAPIASAAPSLKPVGQYISGSPMLQSAIGGGALGVLGSEKGTPLDMLEQGTIGATVGAGGQAAIHGLGKVLNPQLQRLKDLAAQGIDIPKFLEKATIGQTLGGIPQQIENVLNSIPLGGVAPKIEAGVKNLNKMALEKQQAINMAKKQSAQGLTEGFKTAKLDRADELLARHNVQNQALEQDIAKKAIPLANEEADFSRKMVNEAIKTTGIKLKPGVTGTDAIISGQTIADNLYNKAIPKFADEFGDVVITKDTQEALKKVLENNKTRLQGSNYYGRLQDEIDKIIASGGDTSRITPQQWHNIFKEIGAEAESFKKPLSTGFDRDYGNALTQVKNEWIKLIENTPGGELFKKANQVHSAMQVPQAAAAKLEAFLEGGTFDPKQFLSELKKETSLKRFAAGDAKMQEEAFNAYKALAEKRAALKAETELAKSTAKTTQGQEKKEMGRGFGEMDKNVKQQREYLQQQANQQKQGLKEVVEDTAQRPFGSYGQKRLTYDLAGAGLLTGGGTMLNRLAGVDPLTQGMISGGLLGSTNLLYSKPGQDLMKYLATLKRPESVKQIGAGLEAISPVAGIMGAQSFQDMRQRKPKEYTFEEPTQTGGLSVPK